MLKKFALPILILAIIIQLATPVGMITYGKKAEADFEKYGEEFKLEFSCFGIYDGEMHIDVDGYNRHLNYEEYGIPYVREDGTVDIKFSDEKPESDVYIRFTAQNIKKLTYADVGQDVTIREIPNYEKYMVIKVYKGNVEVVELYVDGVPLKDWIELPPETTTHPGEQEILFGDESDYEENLFGE